MRTSVTQLNFVEVKIVFIHFNLTTLVYKLYTIILVIITNNIQKGRRKRCSHAKSNNY